MTLSQKLSSERLRGEVLEYTARIWQMCICILAVYITVLVLATTWVRSFS